MAVAYWTLLANFLRGGGTTPLSYAFCPYLETCLFFTVLHFIKVPLLNRTGINGGPEMRAIWGQGGWML